MSCKWSSTVPPFPEYKIIDLGRMQEKTFFAVNAIPSESQKDLVAPPTLAGCEGLFCL